jgi:hypothetical protein
MFPHDSSGFARARNAAVGAGGGAGTGMQSASNGHPSRRACAKHSAVCAQRLQMSGSHSRAAAKQGHARVLHAPCLHEHPAKLFPHEPPHPHHFSQKFPALAHEQSGPHAFFNGSSGSAAHLHGTYRVVGIARRDRDFFAEL